MSASVDFSALNTTLGAYARENKRALFSKLLLSVLFTDNFTVVSGKDEVPLPRLNIANILQPRNPTAFNPTANALNFSARVLKIRGIKVDLRIYPQELHSTWLGLLDSSNQNRHELPFEAFLMDYIVKRAQENFHLSVLYSGVYNGAGTAAVDCMDGWKELIADLITAGDISAGNGNLVATGVITATNAVDSIEMVYDALHERYKHVPTQCLVSPTIFDWYRRDYRSQFGSNNDYRGMGGNNIEPALYIDGTTCKLVREAGLAGSQRIILTSKDNMVYGVNNTGDSTNIMIEKDHRAIDIMMDFGAGVQFAEVDDRCLVVNNQA